MGDFRRQEDVLKKLFILYERPMYYYALKITADPHTAEDVVQDAFCKMIKYVLVVVLLSGVILMSNVEAFRMKVFEIFLHEQPNYIDFKQIEIPYDKNRIIPVDWNGFWYPGSYRTGLY